MLARRIKLKIIAIGKGISSEINFWSTAPGKKIGDIIRPKLFSYKYKRNKD